MLTFQLQACPHHKHPSTKPIPLQGSVTTKPIISSLQRMTVARVKKTTTMLTYLFMLTPHAFQLFLSFGHSFLVRLARLELLQGSGLQDGWICGRNSTMKWRVLTIIQSRLPSSMSFSTMVFQYVLHGLELLQRSRFQDGQFCSNNLLFFYFHNCIVPPSHWDFSHEKFRLLSLWCFCVSMIH